MHVFKSMNRKELVITFLVFAFIILIVTCGVFLTIVFRHSNYREPPSGELTNSQSASPAPSQTPLPEAQRPDNSTVNQFLSTYGFTAAAISAVIIAIWRKLIYLPALRDCIFIESPTMSIEVDSEGHLQTYQSQNSAQFTHHKKDHEHHRHAS